MAWTEPGRHMWWNNKTNEWFNDTNQVYIKDTERFNDINLIHEWTYKERTKYAQNFMRNNYDEMRSYIEQIVTLQNCMNLRSAIAKNSLYALNDLFKSMKESILFQFTILSNRKSNFSF